jgi:hypothetical protein
MAFGVLYLVTAVLFCSLGDNNIGGEGAVALAGALSVNKSITGLA